MTRTVKYSLTACLFLILGVYSNYSHAATIILENKTKLTLEIDRQQRFVGYAMPQSSFEITGLKRGYVYLVLRPVSKGADGKRKYPIIKKSIIVNNRSEIVRVAINNEDFGHTTIAGPGCDPSMGGKYTNLLRRIQVTDDANHYGLCKDSGKWNGTKYKGYDKLPKGYWVYMYPDWYIWGGINATNTQTNKPKAATGCDTTMGGKYSNPLKTVSVPDDKGQYGECHDWGLWKGKVYKGHKNLPEGYWVYKYPNWIIYGTKN